MNKDYQSLSYQDINAVCCCFNLRKVTRAVTQLFDRYLEEVGVRATQFTVLLTLASVSNKTLTDVAAELVMDRTTLTRNLKPLERQGLITSSELEDRRSRGYVLTAKGIQTIANAMPLWQKAQNAITQQLEGSHYQQLLTELNRLRVSSQASKEFIA